MKNSTKVRLHLSKKLFESLTREIIKEAKANDGYTVAVKQPKARKQVKEVNAVADTDKMKRMEGNVPTSTSTTSVQDMNMGNDGKPAIPGLKEKMSSKEKMAKGLYNEVDAEMDTDKMKKMEEANDFSNHYDYTYRLQDGNCIRINPETQERAKVHHTYCNDLKKEMQVNVAEDGDALQPGENVTWLDGHQREYKGVIQSQEGGDYYKVKITDAPAGGHKVGDILTKQSGDIKKAVGEMQVNVAEDDMLNEMDPVAVTDLLSVLAGMGGIALGGLGIVKWQDNIKAKNPELYKKLQSVSSAISKADPSKDLREKSASLNELRKQIKK